MQLLPQQKKLTKMLPEYSVSFRNNKSRLISESDYFFSIAQKTAQHNNLRIFTARLVYCLAINPVQTVLEGLLQTSEAQGVKELNTFKHRKVGRFSVCHPWKLNPQGTFQMCSLCINLLVSQRFIKKVQGQPVPKYPLITNVGFIEFQELCSM